MLGPDEFGADLLDGLSSATAVDPETSAILGQVKLGCGRAMLQTLTGDLRVAYTMGEILDLDQVEAAAALGVPSSPATRRPWPGGRLLPGRP